MLWHLLLFLFNYDYTLDESGVEKSAETNQQVRALSCLYPRTSLSEEHTMFYQMNPKVFVATLNST